jgi:hypothetical protein
MKLIKKIKMPKRDNNQHKSKIKMLAFVKKSERSTFLGLKLVETAFQNLKDNKKDEEEKVPKSAFPYHKDLLFGMDHYEKVPFSL